MKVVTNSVQPNEQILKKQTGRSNCAAAPSDITIIDRDSIVGKRYRAFRPTQTKLPEDRNPDTASPDP